MIFSQVNKVATLKLLSLIWQKLSTQNFLLRLQERHQKSTNMTYCSMTWRALEPLMLFYVKRPWTPDQTNMIFSRVNKVATLKLLSLIWQKLSTQNFLRNSSWNVPDTQVKWMKKTKAIAFVNRLLPFSQDYYLIC